MANSNNDLLIPLQLPIDIFENECGDVVIWQAGDQMSDDKTIEIARNNVQTVIDSLVLYLNDGGSR